MAAGWNPSRRAATMSVSSSAPQVRFPAAKSSAHMRKNVCDQSQEKPSLISARIFVLTVASRSSWNGVRIASNVPVENA